MNQKQNQKQNIAGKDTPILVSKHFYERWNERVDKSIDNLQDFRNIMAELLRDKTLLHLSGDYFMLENVIVVCSEDNKGNKVLLTTLGIKENCPFVYQTIKYNGAKYFKKILREYGNLYLGEEAKPGDVNFKYN